MLREIDGRPARRLGRTRRSGPSGCAAGRAPASGCSCCHPTRCGACPTCWASTPEQGGLGAERLRPRGLSTAEPLGGDERLALWRRWLVEEPRGWDESGEPGSVAYSDERPRAVPRGRAGAALRGPLHRGQAHPAADPRVRARARALRAAARRWCCSAASRASGRASTRSRSCARPATGRLPRRLARPRRPARRAQRRRPGGAAVGARAVRRGAGGGDGLRPAGDRRDAHGPAEIVDDGETGWLVPPDDEEALADALVEAVNDDDERRRRGEAAYEEAAPRYAWPALARGLAHVYDEVARGPAGRRRARIPCSRHELGDARTGSAAPTGRGAPASSSTAAGWRSWCRAAWRCATSSRSWRRSGPGSSARCGGCARRRPSCRRRGSRTAARCPTWASACRCAVRVEPARRRAARGPPRPEVAWPRSRRRRPCATALERWYRRQARDEVAPAPRRRRRARAGTTLRARSRSAASARAGPVLVERRDELQLAAAARARGDPRLRGRARGGAPRGARPLAALLVAAGRALSATSASTSAGCAATATRCGL